MFLEDKYSTGVGPQITTSPTEITPLHIRETLMSSGVPSGIEIISPDDARARIMRNGYDPRTCYEPEEVIEARLQDPYDLCSLTLFLEQIYDLMPQENLYKVLCEDHVKSAHIMAQACTIAAHPGTMFCDELPVNDLADYAHTVYNLPKSSLDLNSLEKADPQGHLYAQAIIAKTAFHAPLAIKYRYQTILDSNVSVALVDAMTKWDEDYLNESDPLVGEMAQARFGDSIDLTLMDLPTTPDTPEKDIRGVIIRNDIMACRIVSKAFNAAATGNRTTKNGKDLVVATGYSHLGNKIYGSAYKDALPYCILREAYAQGQKNPSVVSVFFETKGDTTERIIPRGRAAGHIPVIIRGLAEDTHKHGFCMRTQQHCLDRLAYSFKIAGQTDHLAYQAFNAPVERKYFEVRNDLRVALL